MRHIRMLKTVGIRQANSDQNVGNRTAAYLVNHGYAEYEGQPKPKRGRPRKTRPDVDPLTMDDLTGGKK